MEGSEGANRLVQPIDEIEIPDTVRSVLSARIDRLDEREKALLQAASVIDKEFSRSVLERVVQIQVQDLEESLRRLVHAEFLFSTSLLPQAAYAFKHPLTQEVAYHSQLASSRAERHAAVA